MFLRHRYDTLNNWLLLSAKPEGGASGGGGTPDEGGAPDNQPKYLTAEEANTMVNAAVSAHAKRLEKSLTEAFGKQLQDVITKIKPANPEPKGNQPTPELVAMQEKLDATARALDETRRRAEQAEISSRNDKAYSNLKSLLNGRVRPEMLDIVASQLFQVQNRVQFQEDGTPLFKIRRAPMPGMSEEEQLLPLADGVEHFLKSKDAAVFLPAPSGGGGGGRGGKLPNAAPTQLGSNGFPQLAKQNASDEEKIRRAMEIEDSILRSQRNQQT